MDEPTAAPRHGRLWMFLAAVALAVVTGAMFYKVLAPGGPVVLSSPACDLSGEFLSARQFGFSQLAHGNLALWNPHIYGGVPFFGNFQSALLYPPNWIFMALPTEAAVNWSIAAHVLLLGLGMLAWARWRGISVAGGLLGALVVMFGGAHFLHIYAGHLSNLCTMAWAPLLLAAVDGCLDRRRLPWALMGSMVVAMMVLAGHPQYVFFSGIVAAIYALARLWHRLLACVRRPQPKNRPHKVSGPQAESLCHQEQLRSLGHVLGLLSIVALGGLALAAVQLLAGLAAASSSVRTGGLRQDVAGMFSLPPENLLMLIAPWFYGVPGAPYWGKWYPWEMTLFIGAAGGLLAAAGIARGRLAGRRAATVTLGITLLLAMGSYTPLFELIYRLPLFNMLRGLSKFIFQASLFLGLFAGAGLDAVVGSRRRWNLLAAAAAAVALAVLAGAAWIRFDAAAGDMGGWRHFMSNLQTKTVGKLVQVYLDPKFYHSPEFLRDSSAQATRSLLFGAGALAVGAALLMLTRWWRLAGYCIALLAVGEVLYFASAERPTFTPGLAPMLKALTTQAARPIDYRILNEFNRNQAMETEFDDVWGSGPDIRQRWAEYFCVATGRPLERVSQYADFRKWDCRQMFAAARLKYVMLQGPQNQIASFQILNPLGRLELVPQWRIVSGREAVLAVLADPAFDPRRTVILETPLPLTGEGGPQGRVRVPAEATNALASAPAAATPLPFMGEGGPQGRVRVPDVASEAPAAAPAPASQPAAQVRLLASSTDWLTLEADVPAPTILLITDAYDPHWRVTALEGSSQRDYTLMPGDWAFQAVPLAAGHHHLRLEYRPAAFSAGRWISLAAGLLYLGAWLAWWRLGRRPQAAANNANSPAAAAAGHPREN